MSPSIYSFKKLFSVSLKLLPNFFVNFKIFYQFLFQCYPGFSNLHFCKIYLKFSKNYRKIFSPKTLEYCFCTPLYLYSFFKVSSQLILIRNCTTMSAKPLRENLKFPQNFITIFNNLNNCFQNVSVIF